MANVSTIGAPCIACQSATSITDLQVQGKGQLKCTKKSMNLEHPNVQFSRPSLSLRHIRENKSQNPFHFLTSTEVVFTKLCKARISTSINQMWNNWLGESSNWIMIIYVNMPPIPISLGLSSKHSSILSLIHDKGRGIHLALSSMSILLMQQSLFDQSLLLEDFWHFSFREFHTDWRFIFIL